MQITDIKRQRRRETRYSVYVDGEYAFALSDLELSTSGLRIGQELAAHEVAEYQDSAQEARAYAMALRFLSYRPRSVKEMRDHLRRKEIADSDLDAAIGRLLKAGLLDDVAFADAWVRSRQALRPRSQRMLAQELAAKGISRDDAAEVLGSLDANQELERLVELMERKRRLPQYAAAEKLMGYFARQGYGYDVLKQALERLQTQ